MLPRALAWRLTDGRPQAPAAAGSGRIGRAIRGPDCVPMPFQAWQDDLLAYSNFPIELADAIHYDCVGFGHSAELTQDEIASVNRGDMWERFQALRIWAHGNQRAPHKPLLALWSIGRCLRGAARMAPFATVEGELARLLRSFGPNRKATHPEFPFWRMQKDEIWEIDRPNLVRTTASGDAHKACLVDHDIHGGLLPSVYEAFRKDPHFALRVAESLVEAHFPSTLHEAVLKSTGIEDALSNSAGRSLLGDGVLQVMDVDDFVTSRRRKRNPAFRGKVLQAYAHRCAVCRFAVRLKEQPLALDAAHIRWHEAAGPAQVRNGLALCSLHHKLFDWGAFTVVEKQRVFEVLITDMAHGPGFDESLKRFQGTSLHTPTRLIERPAKEFLEWHHSEVFRSSFAN